MATQVGLRSSTLLDRMKDMSNHWIGIVQNGYQDALAVEPVKLRIQDLPGEAPHDVHVRPQEV